tara:strand:- start:413 stop:697 length:285 start_codon:yes stop_codon:yes gene_type:complete
MEDSQECQFCGYCEYEEDPKINFWNKHLNYVGESYWEHSLAASKLSLRLFVSAISQAIHALLPFVRPPFGTDVCSLSDYIESVKPEARVQRKEE